MRPVEQCVHLRIAATDAVDPDAATERCTLWWNGATKVRFHDAAQCVSANQTAVESAPSDFEIGIGESKEAMKLTTLVDPTDPILPEWSLVVAALFVETGAAAADCDMFE